MRSVRLVPFVLLAATVVGCQSQDNLPERPAKPVLGQVALQVPGMT